MNNRYLINNGNNKFPMHCYWDKSFTEDELDTIITYGNSLVNQEAVIGVGKNLAIRKTHISWIENCQQSKWIFNRFSNVCNNINDEYYQFKLTMHENMQFTKYDTLGSKYDFHTDSRFGNSQFVNNTMRKLTMILFLSNSSDYEGGELLMNKGGSPDPERWEKIEQVKGKIILFPSFIPHCVTPITSGKRISLVNWIRGPKWS